MQKRRERYAWGGQAGRDEACCRGAWGKARGKQQESAAVGGEGKAKRVSGEAKDACRGGSWKGDDDAGSESENRSLNARNHIAADSRCEAWSEHEVLAPVCCKCGAAC